MIPSLSISIFTATALIISQILLSKGTCSTIVGCSPLMSRLLLGVLRMVIYRCRHWGLNPLECPKPQHCPDTIYRLSTRVLPEVWYRHEVNDELMRFFEHCRGFVEAVENNKTALAEVKKFKEGPEMGDVRRKMAQQLNVPYERVTPGLA